MKLLVNDTSIKKADREKVTYHRDEPSEHAVILAEGLTVQSDFDTGDRTNFDGEETVRLLPDFTARLAPDAAMLWETRGRRRWSWPKPNHGCPVGFRGVNWPLLLSWPDLFRPPTS